MSSNLELKKTCQFCGEEFIARTTTTQYCSLQCAQRAYKKRKREEKMQLAAQKEENVQQNPATPPNLIKEILSTQEVADLMGVTRTTVHRYCVAGTIPCKMINRKIFIRRKDIEHMFDAAGPHIVTPIEREPITEFYSLQEIMDKYNCSPSLVYTTVKAKKIPHVEFRGKTIYSKKHIDKHMSHRIPDPTVKDWITVTEIMEKYGMTKQAVYGFVSDNKIQKKSENNKAYYPREQVESLLQNRVPDPSITEWYTMEDIEKKYGLKQLYVSNLIFKNPIPKVRKGHKVLLSKTHFDQLIKEKEIVPEYYTVEEAMAKFNISRDALYYHVRKNNIPKKQEGRYVKISKKELDLVFLQQPIIL